MYMHRNLILCKAVIGFPLQTMFTSQVGLFFCFKLDVVSFVSIYGK